MSKHTPGPWKTWNETITGEIAIQARFQDGSDDGIPFNIAFVVAHPAHGDGKYHARLITAAPEMVKALRDLVDCFEDGSEFTTEARALLARIEGE